MALTDAKIRAAKPTDKAYKLTDGAGMFLLVHPNGSRYWRLRYRILGKEKTLALGVYPEVSLSEARTKRDEARKLISEGIDPCEQKRAKKVVPDLQLSFEHIARRWHASNKQWAQSHSDKVLKSLETHVFPFIGNVYCSNGWVGIDNNIAENALRGVAVGRKNWLFAGSDSGDEHAAVLYSLIGTCRLNNVEPEKWLRYVIEHIQD
ncbi:hypothetical protein C3444_01170 [Escherichia coli]|nr:DUF4102 domain-containing protein [Escherichia coli]EFH5641688.1 DUF4102 domain-containing protein [Escherichia coli]ROW73000.1 hypothetical protein C3444_01170 [Escherichia coli]ROW73604.1 hypothetical protein C3443_01170 [Escherichia coli]HAN4139312.1 integrase arm-type DNA-binding domain-containing protein [Escherichia coli]